MMLLMMRAMLRLLMRVLMKMRVSMKMPKMGAVGCHWRDIVKGARRVRVPLNF